MISRGRTSEGSEATPTQVSMSIRNTDGRYSPRNPTGPYYGVIGRNTPLRVRVGPAAQAASFLGLTPGENLSTPDHASLRIVGDLDCALRPAARLVPRCLNGLGWPVQHQW
nr:hypothetical protein [Salinispora arenicola]